MTATARETYIVWLAGTKVFARKYFKTCKKCRLKIQGEPYQYAYHADGTGTATEYSFKCGGCGLSGDFTIEQLTQIKRGNAND